MKKLIAASVVLAGVMSSAAHADTICCTEAYAGGFELWTVYGGFCQVGSNDLTYNTLFSESVAAQANQWHNSSVYSAANVGWGYGTYGGANCAAIYGQP